MTFSAPSHSQEVETEAGATQLLSGGFGTGTQAH